MFIDEDKVILAIGLLVVSPVAKKDLLRLEKDLTVRYLWRGEVKGFTIRKGYTYDGASVPLSNIDFSPKLLRASLVHDWFCELYNNRDEVPVDFTVDEMSEVFGEILKLDGVDCLISEIMEAAVTIYKLIT